MGKSGTGRGMARERVGLSGEWPVNVMRWVGDWRYHPVLLIHKAYLKIVLSSGCLFQQTPFLVVELPSEEQARQIMKRTVLVKYVIIF